MDILFLLHLFKGKEIFFSRGNSLNNTQKFGLHIFFWKHSVASHPASVQAAVHLSFAEGSQGLSCILGVCGLHTSLFLSFYSEAIIVEPS